MSEIVYRPKENKHSMPHMCEPPDPLPRDTIGTIWQCDCGKYRELGWLKSYKILKRWHWIPKFSAKRIIKKAEKESKKNVKN